MIGQPASLVTTAVGPAVAGDPGTVSAAPEWTAPYRILEQVRKEIAKRLDGAQFNRIDLVPDEADFANIREDLDYIQEQIVKPLIDAYALYVMKSVAPVPADFLKADIVDDMFADAHEAIDKAESMARDDEENAR